MTPSIAQTQLSLPPFDTITPFSLAATNESRTTIDPSDGVSASVRGGESEVATERKVKVEGGGMEGVEGVDEGR